MEKIVPFESLGIVPAPSGFIIMETNFQPLPSVLGFYGLYYDGPRFTEVVQCGGKKPDETDQHAFLGLINRDHFPESEISTWMKNLIKSVAEQYPFIPNPQW
jgi:hypothetical protein